MSMFEFWKKLKASGANSLRTRGFAGSVKRATEFSKDLATIHWKRFAVWSPWNPWYCFLDRRFDRRYAVDTAGVLILPEIHSDCRFNGYSPTPHSFFNRLMHQVEIDHQRFTFIDFGCGKGKALLLAASFPFRRIIGIEVSSVLIAVAESNLKTYRGSQRCRTIELVHSDVREFRFPEEPAVCYFWDPFESELMQAVLRNLQESLSRKPRETYIVYFVPVHRSLFDQSEFLTLLKQESWYCIYRAELASDAVADSN